MYLKSLDIQGFKSFPDRISLKFDKGITAVVGPNGSGKSNIGDAVRWVLGEQSSKTLRGAKMEDVIFSGTEFRKPMGFAQVTLEIDNRDRKLDVDDDTASVTRKLYRSGESEYLINGKNCRLKDITELFLDTGLGRDGYSVIGQGKIAEIVSAKSSERRDIFEEAAGISKFRFRKAEAEKRLVSAEENLVRLQDIASELESRLAPLKVQSEKAAEFLRLSEIKKSLEITLWVNDISEIKKTLSELENKILINTADYENTEAEINRAEEKMSELTRDMQDSRIRIDELRQRIRDTESKDSKINSDIAVCENEIRHAEEDIRSYKESIEGAKNSDAQSIGEIKKKLKEKNDTEKELADTSKAYGETEKILSELTKQEESANKSLESETGTLNKLYITKSQFVSSVETGKRALREMAERLGDFDGRKSTLENSLKSSEKELNETESAEKLCDEKITEEKNRLAGISSLYSKKSEKLREADSELNSLTLKIKEINQKLSFLKGLENSMEGLSSAVKLILKCSAEGALGGIRGTLSQIISTESKYSAAVETAAGYALQNIVTDNEENAKDAIKYLKARKAGRATFLPVTSVSGKRLAENLDGCEGFVSLACDTVKFDEKYRGIVYSVLGRTAVFEDIDSAAAAAKSFGYRFKIVTLDGQVINAGGSFTGGSLTKSTGILSRKSEIEGLTRDLRETEKKNEESQAARNKLKAECDKLFYDTESSKEKIHSLETDKVRFEAEKKRITDLSAQINNQLNALEDEKRNARKRSDEYSSQISASEKRLNEIEKEIAEREKASAEKNEEKEKLTKKRSSLSDKLSALKISETALSKDIENITAEIERMENTRKEIGDNSARLFSMINDAEKLIKSKQDEIISLKNSLSDSGEIIDRLNDKITDEKALSGQKEQEVTSLRRKSRELSDIKEKITGEKSRLEEKKIAVNKSYDDIIKAMEEQYSLYLSEAEKLTVEIESVPAAKKELDGINRRIRSLGNVNVGAVEEYKEVSERYEFMSGQLRDVLDSKKKIEDIIKDLTETMKRQFYETFNKINDNFGKIFTELFGGGRGNLTLTDPENVLESGIDINVAPPGKVIKNLSLLSGGEQSFVAIALYFAILNIKPSPFCILDEIEAALDDVNVSRYAKYLRKYTDETQFIAITHRRGTMDEADVLYGVTMQQKGVSRLIKLEQPSDAQL